MIQNKPSAELRHLHRLPIMTGAPELVPAAFPLTTDQAAQVRGQLLGGFPTVAKGFLKHLVKRQ